MLAGMSLSSSARAQAAHYDDETTIYASPVQLQAATDARVAPNDQSALVAHLTAGQRVTHIATHGHAVLVEFEDPNDPKKWLEGWIPKKALDPATTPPEVPEDAPPPASAPVAPPTRAATIADTPLGETPLTSPESPKPKRIWYGSQTLAIDGVSALLIAIGAATVDRASSGGDFLALGVMTYEFGAPIVHWAHGHVGVGFGSHGLRLLSLVGVYGGAALVADGNLPAAVALILSLCLGPPILDGAALAYDEPKQKKASWILPTVVPTKNGATVGLVGSF